MADLIAGRFATSRRQGAFTEYELTLIANKRLAGAPDRAIALMVGRPVLEVRLVPQPEKPEEQAQPIISATVPMPPAGTIMRAVWAAHKETGIPMQGILGPSKVAEIARARQIAYWYARQVRREDGSPRYSQLRIAKFFGKTDHTAVRSGILKIQSERGGAA